MGIEPWPIDQEARRAAPLLVVEVGSADGVLIICIDYQNPSSMIGRVNELYSPDG